MQDITLETVVIGAGQAGLSTGYHLAKKGREFVILDAASRVGDQWRRQWDSLRLYLPAKYVGLPGLGFPAKPWTFPGKDAVGDYLEQYATHFSLPIRFDTRVERLEARSSGGYLVTTPEVRYTCTNVVIATGTFGRTPRIPDFAADLDPGIQQLHSSEYRRPGQLQDGPVLVVGASHSGTDIAYEVAQSHPTILAGRDCGQIPFRIESGTARRVFPILMFLWQHLLTRRTPIGTKMMPELRYHGGPMLRVKRSDLAERDVERITDRVTGVRNGRPVVGERELDVANVVWSTGFQQNFDWIDLPILKEDGWPTEKRGVATQAPGLYFCGLAFQYAFSSMLLAGVGRDAEYVVNQIVRHTTTSSAADPVRSA